MKTKNDIWRIILKPLNRDSKPFTYVADDVMFDKANQLIEFFDNRGTRRTIPLANVLQITQGGEEHKQERGDENDNF